MTANSKGLPKEPVYGEDGWNKSNVEQQKQPSDRKSNHCHILTKKKAALWAQIFSEAKNQPRPSQNKHPFEPELRSPTEVNIDEMDLMSLDGQNSEQIALGDGTWHRNLASGAGCSNDCDSVHGVGSLKHWKLWVHWRLRLENPKLVAKTPSQPHNQEENVISKLLVNQQNHRQTTPSVR